MLAWESSGSFAGPNPRILTQALWTLARGKNPREPHPQMLINFWSAVGDANKDPLWGLEGGKNGVPV